MSRFTALVPNLPGDQINTGLNPCPTNLLIQKYGLPVKELPKNCAPKATNSAWSKRFITADVGPFRVTGHKLAVGLLRESLAAVKLENPELYAELGSAGMLCIRYVRGKPGVPSNHSLGLAIDFLIDGELDKHGDNKVFVGLIELYSVLKRFGWFWGAEFSKEDAMHFEVSAEVVRGWIKQGIF